MDVEEFLAALEDIEAQSIELDKAEKKKWSMDRCKRGDSTWYRDKINKLLRGRWWCKNWRDCPICFSVKVNTMVRKLERHEAEGKEYVILDTTEANYKKLVRKHGKAKFLRIPGDNDTVTVFACTTTGLEGDEGVSPRETDMRHIVENIPLKKKTSGSLGAAPKKSKDKVAILVDVITIDNATEAEIIAADIEATERTPFDQATTPEELKDQIDTRQNTLVAILEELGAIISIVGKKRIGCDFLSTLVLNREKEITTEQAIGELFNP
jgi:hypothetical protein